MFSIANHDDYEEFDNISVTLSFYYSSFVFFKEIY